MCFTSSSTSDTHPRPRLTQYTNYDNYLRDRDRYQRDRYQRDREAYLKKEKKNSRKRGNYAGVHAAGSFGAIGGCGGGGGC